MNDDQRKLLEESEQFKNFIASPIGEYFKALAADLISDNIRAIGEPTSPKPPVFYSGVVFGINTLMSTVFKKSTLGEMMIHELNAITEAQKEMAKEHLSNEARDHVRGGKGLEGEPHSVSSGFAREQDRVSDAL